MALVVSYKELVRELRAARSDRDAVLAQLAKAREALRPFADIDGEGDEDFTDEERVTLKYGHTIDYTLRLGNFRRARAVLAELEEPHNG